MLTKKRRAISNETKMEIIENKKRLTPTELSVEYGLPISTIATIQANKEKIKQHFEESITNAHHKRIRLSNFPIIEESMQVWFNQIMSKPNITLDGPVLKAQASKFAELHGIKGFKASNGWLDGFKKRNNISFKSIVGEGGLVDVSTIVLFCANMDGSEKMRPVVIGSSENPRCFKNINKNNLPVFYRSNKTSWMTNDIFTEWLINADKHFKSESRNVLLFLDNFSGHKSDLNLTNIKIHYFPPNCTSILQPMDQGIIQSFKMKYRRSIIEDKL